MHIMFNGQSAQVKRSMQVSSRLIIARKKTDCNLISSTHQNYFCF
jgi:hypothetical protein